MQSSKLSFRCPACGSADVFYSCTPNCCYNHVCADCGATFEPETSRKPGAPPIHGVIPPDPLPDATDPTAGCAACDSPAVYQLATGDVVCGRCGTVLVLEITDTSAANAG